MNSEIAIKVDNLSKCYTLRHPIKDADGNDTYEHWALRDVSFEIKKGESVGIIGPNGSGKSTLLKILAGVTKPTLGKVTIHGKVASILDIGSGFHPELSGRENVFLNGQIHGFSRKEIEAKFDEIIAFSGIEKLIDEPVKNYSNGMYLRLAFSIMAHLDFDVYLLDEVLSVGDDDFKEKVHFFIQEILKERDITIFIVSHNFNEIATFCDKSLIIQNGELKKEGNSIESVQFLKRSFEEKRLEGLKYCHDYLDKLELSILVNDQEVDTVCQNDAITLKIKINKNKKALLRFGIRVRDILGNIVFEISYSDSQNQKLLNKCFFELQVEIPPNYFNHGCFYFDIIGIDEISKNVAFLELNTFYLTVLVKPHKDAFWLQKISGPVHPVFNWEIIES